MYYESFKNKFVYPGSNATFIYGSGALPINIKIAQLATFANSDTKQQGYYVTEVNKLISTMLTGVEWNQIGGGYKVPKSMSNNYLELTLSCDNGFVIKKRLQFPHIIAWQNDDTPYNIADVYKEFSVDNWLKADDFITPDITLVVEPMNEIITTSGDASASVNEESGRFYLYYRNLPVGVNRVHIEFHIKTKTEPIDFDLEVIDGNFAVYKEELPSNKNLKYSNVKEIFAYNGAGGNFEDITMFEWDALYHVASDSIFELQDAITHDLFFYPYV